jgi:hypothetical protein
MDWLTFKNIVEQLPISKDALHIYVALGIQVAAALTFRRSLGSIVPWSAVLIAELLNEALDLHFEKEAYIHKWQILGSVHDLVNTLILPTALMVGVRFVPNLFQSRHAESVELQKQDNSSVASPHN